MALSSPERPRSEFPPLPKGGAGGVNSPSSKPGANVSDAQLVTGGTAQVARESGGRSFPKTPPPKERKLFRPRAARKKPATNKDKEPLPPLPPGIE